MNREFSGWGVIVTGALLALLGGYWLLAGWEHIQIERGWSQFIAGAIALSGGTITMAIGRLIRFLVRQPLATAPAQTGAREPVSSPSARPAGRPPEPSKRVRSPERAAVASSVAGKVGPGFEPQMSQEATLPARVETTGSNGQFAEPSAAMTVTPAVYATEGWRAEADYADAEVLTEVDRYTAGDATYVMYVDGSVEVRTPEGARRYESLDALRADSGER